MCGVDQVVLGAVRASSSRYHRLGGETDRPTHRMVGLFPTAHLIMEGPSTIAGMSLKRRFRTSSSGKTPVGEETAGAAAAASAPEEEGECTGPKSMKRSKRGQKAVPSVSGRRSRGSAKTQTKLSGGSPGTWLFVCIYVYTVGFEVVVGK